MQLIMVLGYLGSGKTTFVLNALEGLAGKKAVLVNDFGSLDVDGVVLEKQVPILKKVYDGSIFCSCKSDMFVANMLDIVKENPDIIIVEASGLANPYTMLREINLIEDKGNVKFDLNVFCLVDARTFENILPICHAIKIQIATSDVIIINKTDLSNRLQINRVKELIKENSQGQIIETVNAKIDKYFGYELVPKTMPKLIEDILLQKITLNVNCNDIKELEEECIKLSQISSRIKGIITINNKHFIYEYIDGQSKYKQTEKEGNYLVVLSCFKRSLKKEVERVIASSKILSII